MTNSGEDKMQFLNSAGNFSDLEGDLIAPNQSNSNFKPSTTLNMGSNQEIISTLDEPVSITISRDLKAVAYKLGHVFFPKQSTLLLKDWDLWGPLTLCVILSISLEGNYKVNSNAPEFASVFALISFGAIVVTINTKLLSGKISFFQSICVLGYCLLPLVIVAILNDLILFITGNASVISFGFRFILIVVSCFWSVFASTAFLAADTINLSDRKALATYPVFLFYFVISWLIILHTN
ncbi:hypothetical protein BpHYR1_005276 [Brachionus plicatilis]|uniref:Protein YIPF n=1 Tax=Brachionus plicatilis TaxID=10195 RepID=A0A3M7P1Q4_BRAPC|nr:hypothetical protein BpHYR1_005276 [Brachionus plicatilis]